MREPRGQQGSKQPPNRLHHDSGQRRVAAVEQELAVAEETQRSLLPQTLPEAEPFIPSMLPAAVALVAEPTAPVTEEPPVLGL